MSKPPPPCGIGKRRFPSRRAADRRLGEILDQPLTIDRLYQPTGVIRCPMCGGFHLTSKSGKRWKKGKLSRDLRCR